MSEILVAILAIVLGIFMILGQLCALLKNLITMYSAKNYVVEFPFFLNKLPEHFLFLITTIVSIMLLLLPTGMDALMIFLPVSMLYFIFLLIAFPWISPIGNGYSKKQYFKKVYNNYILSLRYYGISPTKTVEELHITVDDQLDNPFITTDVVNNSRKRILYKFKTINRFFITKIVIHKSEANILNMLSTCNIKIEKEYEDCIIWVTPYKLTTDIMNFIFRKTDRFFYTQNYKINRMFS